MKKLQDFSMFILRCFNPGSKSSFRLVVHNGKRIFTLGPFLSLFNTLQCCDRITEFFKQSSHFKPKWNKKYPLVIVEPKLYELFLGLKRSRVDGDKEVFKNTTSKYEIYHPTVPSDEKYHPECFQKLVSKANIFKILELLEGIKMKNVLTNRRIQVEFQNIPRCSNMATFFAEVPGFIDHLPFQKPPKALKKFGPHKNTLKNNL